MPLKRTHLFAALTVLISTLIGLLLAEWILRGLESANQQEHMQPGLLKFDARLGWRMTPSWQGRHQHQDYDVQYRIGKDGFRITSGQRPAAWKERVMWIGDSFTFGLGVQDQQTFVSRLNELDDQRRHRNLGVPGYSTDQQVLLLQQELVIEQPDRVVLVLYLANDPLDNLRDFPLQAANIKPRFIWSGTTLMPPQKALRPRSQPPEGQTGLARAVFGTDWPTPPWHAQLLQSSRLAGRLGLHWQPPAEPLRRELDTRLKPAIDITVALLQRAEALAQKRNARFAVVLLPGRGLYQSPNSPSQLYQAHLLNKLNARLRSVQINVLDISPELDLGLFHPHDGHLTAAGNRVLAEKLLPWLAR